MTSSSSIDPRAYHPTRGTRLELSFVLPGGYQVITEGQVSWSRDPVDRQKGSSPGMGVSFTALSNDDR